MTTAWPSEPERNYIADMDRDISLEICILFDITSNNWGGGNQFLRSLASELSQMGHTVTQRPTKTTQVILLNSFLYARGKHLVPRQVAQLRQSGKMSVLGKIIPLSIQMKRSRNGPALIHRVDGVPELARGKRTLADDVQPAVNRLTDYTVFQSEYCRTTFSEQCGFSPANSTVIHNGVDPRLFHPGGDTHSEAGAPLRLVAVSWSPNRRKGFDTLAEMSKLPGVELTFAGNWCPEVGPANVKLAGVLQSQELADLMRSSDAMVHAGWNEACSNVIVEAMACGLPVVYRDSGGNRELAGEFGLPLADDLPSVIESLRRQLPHLQRKIRDNWGSFHIEWAAREYVSAFREVAASVHNSREN